MYVASLVTASTSGVQPANVYVYCPFAAFVGVVAPSYVGVVPYTTFSSVSSTVPSSFFHITVYLFTVLVYVAVYVASPVTTSTFGVQPSNVYVYCAFAAFVGVAPS